MPSIRYDAARIALIMPGECETFLRTSGVTPGDFQGFSEAFLAIQPAAQAFLDGSANLVLTGHGLQAALATLAASVFPGSMLVTFGSPRVGDKRFADHVLATTPIQFQHVDCCDFVTTMPPPFPGFYYHCGDESYVDRDGSSAPGVGTVAKAVDQFEGQAEYACQYSFKHGDVALRSFTDHSPISYVRIFS